MPIDYEAFTGIITAIHDLGAGGEAGCYKMVSVVSDDGGPLNFIVTPTTYFVDHEVVAVGDRVTGFYDANAPAPAIYPPQLQAHVMAKHSPYYQVKVDFFDSQFLSGDGTLQLILAPCTQVRLENDQIFTGDPANRYLIVIYGATTRSIPAQTTPFKIIVLCR